MVRDRKKRPRGDHGTSHRPVGFTGIALSANYEAPPAFLLAHTFQMKLHRAITRSDALVSQIIFLLVSWLPA